MKQKWLLTVFTLAIVSISLTGCALFLVGAGVAIGVGSVAYVNGELKGAEEVSVDHAWAAAQKTMDELQFKIAKSQKDALAGLLIARRADGTPIHIRVNRRTDKVTEIRIRVGTFGDEALSRLIYDKIKHRM